MFACAPVSWAPGNMGRSAFSEEREYFFLQGHPLGGDRPSFELCMEEAGRRIAMCSPSAESSPARWREGHRVAPELVGAAR